LNFRNLQLLSPVSASSCASSDVGGGCRQGQDGGMHGHSAVGWRQAYEALIGRLPLLVETAPLTLCGLSVCVDARIAMQDLGPLFEAREPPRAVALASVLLDRAQRGVGGEIAFDWPEGPSWLAARVAIRRSLGGTGAQAARTLAAAGAPALIALQDRSAAMLDCFDPKILLADEGRLVEASAVRPRGEPGPEIFIFEYTAGVRLAGDIVPPRSSRIIVRFANKGLEHDQDFEMLSPALAATAGAGLVSGFNAVPFDQLDAEIVRAAAIAAAWKASGLATIHLELAGYDTVEACQKVMEGLRGSVDSIGMSQSEFLTLARALMPEMAADIGAGMVALGERFGLNRVCVHADHWAAAATLSEPAVERDALMMGCLMSSARAAAGRPVCPQTVDTAAEFHPPLFPVPVSAGQWTLVSCASPYLAAPATTLGLGDSFTAGCLLVIGCAASDRAALGSLTDG
jgi:ADP-dependent phosphofructokinase/glucokinase